MVFLERFVSETLGLTKFPPYLSTFYFSFLGFLFVHQVVAPVLSSRWFPNAYKGKSKVAQNNWLIHVVSQVHVLIIVPGSLYVIFTEPAGRADDKIWGWDNRAGYVHAIASGFVFSLCLLAQPSPGIPEWHHVQTYFLWDSLDAIFNFIDAGFVVHGLSCLAIYTMSFKPFVAYYGTRCLLWEASTFFLNNHWLMDKTGRTGTRLQLVNGFFLLLTFFSVRMVYGGYISIQFLIILKSVWREIPLFYTLLYGGGNFILQGLNWFWFYKMIQALRKRFRGGPAVKLPGEDEIPTHMPNGPPPTNDDATS